MLSDMCEHHILSMATTQWTKLVRITLSCVIVEINMTHTDTRSYSSVLCFIIKALLSICPLLWCSQVFWGTLKVWNWSLLNLLQEIRQKQQTVYKHNTHIPVFVFQAVCTCYQSPDGKHGQLNVINRVTNNHWHTKIRPKFPVNSWLDLLGANAVKQKLKTFISTSLALSPFLCLSYTHNFIS